MIKFQPMSSGNQLIRRVKITSKSRLMEMNKWIKRERQWLRDLTFKILKEIKRKNVLKFTSNQKHPSLRKSSIRIYQAQIDKIFLLDYLTSTFHLSAVHFLLQKHTWDSKLSMVSNTLGSQNEAWSQPVKKKTSFTQFKNISKRWSQ